MIGEKNLEVGDKVTIRDYGYIPINSGEILFGGYGSDFYTTSGAVSKESLRKWQYEKSPEDGEYTIELIGQVRSRYGAVFCFVSNETSSFIVDERGLEKVDSAIDIAEKECEKVEEDINDLKELMRKKMTCYGIMQEKLKKLESDRVIAKSKLRKCCPHENIRRITEINYECSRCGRIFDKSEIEGGKVK